MESDLTKFDTIVGDGDCGETFARGAMGGCRFVWSVRVLTDAFLFFSGS